jgi:tellurite resistance protein TerC
MVQSWMWLLFGAVIVALLFVDLVVAGRHRGIPSFRSAASWSVAWTLVALAFTGVLAAWQGGTAAEQYLAGYLIERSLSLDNLFVFALLFGYFAVPAESQRRVLFVGIVGAIVLRAIFILAGGALLDAFHFTLYLFGVFLILTGLRMATHDNTEIHPERNPVLSALRRFVPLLPDYRGERIFVREGGRWVATPLLAALVMVATFDVLFAVDSIPAIFAVTRDTFIVFAANAFSLLGMVSLYFLLAGMIERFRYLNLGLAAILVFVGAKMLASEVWKVPTTLSLTVIVASLTAAVLASLVRERADTAATPHAKGEARGHGQAPQESPAEA